jgi:hypothetical protein
VRRLDAAARDLTQRGWASILRHERGLVDELDRQLATRARRGTSATRSAAATTPCSPGAVRASAGMGTSVRDIRSLGGALRAIAATPEVGGRYTVTPSGEFVPPVSLHRVA